MSDKCPTCGTWYEVCPCCKVEYCTVCQELKNGESGGTGE